MVVRRRRKRAAPKGKITTSRRVVTYGGIFKDKKKADFWKNFWKKQGKRPRVRKTKTGFQVFERWGK